MQNKGGVGDGEALSHEAESNTATSEQTTAAPSQTEANTETTQPENAFKVNEGDKETVYTNNYIVLLDNRLMEQYTNVYKKMDVYAKTLNKLKSQIPDVKVYSLMAPTSIEFYAPKKYNSGKSHSQYQGINYIYGELKGITPVDAYPEIAAHTNEYLYFRSDHHWTARGAYYAYRAFAKTAGFTPVDINTSRPANSPRSSARFTGRRRARRLKSIPTMSNISFQKPTPRPLLPTLTRHSAATTRSRS